MPFDAAPLIGFNRGIISPRGLARADMKRVALSGEIMTNWLPAVLGSMMLRPGTGYLSQTFNNQQAVTIPFVYSATDLAKYEISANTLRPMVNDQPLTRVSVATTVANSAFTIYLLNGSFSGSAANWTLGSGWTYSSNTASATTANGAVTQNANFALVNGVSYVLTFTITRSAGSLTPSVGGTNGTVESAAGTYSQTITAGATQVISFTGSGFTGTLTNVSLEVAPTVGSGTVTASASTGWVQADDTGCVSALGSSALNFNGTGGSAARRNQTLSIAGGDQAKLHALRIVINSPGGTVGGGIHFRLGTTAGGDDLINDTILGTGTHSIAFTPGAASVFIQFYSYNMPLAQVTQCSIEAAGAMTLPAPWQTSDLPSLRWEASEDVTWVVCYGYQARKIERRGSGASASFSIVLYNPPDGPFQLENSGPITLTPSSLTGNITLTSSQAMFYPTHVGALFQINSIGQVGTGTLSGANQTTSYIKVTGGTAGSRAFAISVTGTYSGTVYLQYSIGAPGAWQNVPGAFVNSTTWNNPSYNDGLLGQIVYYQLAMTSYTSGSAVCQLTFAGGSVPGIVQVTGYTDSKTVSCAVLEQLGGLTASALWSVSSWSNNSGWPSDVKLYEGRLYFFGQSTIYGSLPNAFESFDNTVVGDSGVINRSFGSGPQDRAMWCASLQRLLIGGALDEWSIHSDSFDDPLTPSNNAARCPSTQGAANVAALRLDSRAIFVGRSTTKLFELTMGNQGGFLFDYVATNLSQAVPELLLPGIVRTAVQRHPDTRIHCVLADGTVAVLVSDPNEDCTAWVLFSLPGGQNGGNAIVEDCYVLPGAVEDSVYYVVNRYVNGQTVRYHEKFSLQMTQCQGGNLNLQMDSFITGTNGSPGPNISLPHLVGQTVVVWADGAPIVSANDPSVPQTFTVGGGGAVNVGTNVTNWAAGVPYTATFKSAKFTGPNQQSFGLSKKKKIDTLSCVLYNTYYQGLKFCRDGVNWQNIPQIYQGKAQTSGTIYSQFDQEAIPFPGSWDPDARLWLQAQSPFPCTILAAVPEFASA